MRVLVFDTETNGLPKQYKVPYTDLENWPVILQIAWTILDLPTKKYISSSNYLVKPAGEIVWDESAERIHKISQSKIQTSGRPFSEILQKWKNDITQVDAIVAHNLQFDKNVFFAECMRSRLDPTTLWCPNEICSMLSTIHVCKLKSTYATSENSYKWPKLIELYQYLFPDREDPLNLHDAAGDVRCLCECVLELHRRGLFATFQTTDRRVDLPLCIRLDDFFVNLLDCIPPSIAKSRRAASSER